MTVMVGLDAAIVAALEPHLPAGARATAVDPAKETTTKDGAIWIRGMKSTSGWRGIGGTAAQTHARRRETVRVTLAALAYRQAGQHLDAAADAKAKVLELVSAVEDAIEADEDLSLGGAVTWSRLGEIEIETWPKDSGWSAGAVIVIECESRP